ncbi:tripartite tricarboxylate transporter substrate binding protein [Hoyosella sp. YIM 151337]|uniref:tripartite tricarboxylate transporter substrate binding protein n=1 Tax=Hoyosella sp. YIM 151337 TaxID=2992742 RepID=UPI002235BBDC|nr:tripartite tricarboxylate transporter substrate binding protein [Hoyosella sp. YIM 151337]MCW4353765.1 tripartite tricarboxylate transporter substrate binding protein [Hoyosella sp. YIM 151337]
MKTRLAFPKCAIAAFALITGFSATACTGTDVAEDGAWSPSRPIEMIAPAATGGGWDTLARTSTRLLDEAGLNDKQFRVINKPGAGGAIGWAYIAANSGDPHKLFVTSPPMLLVPMTGQAQNDYTEFTPIARLATDYMVYVVPGNSPIESFEEVAEQLRTRPGSFPVAGGSSPGSMDHVAVAGAALAVGAEPSDLNYVAFDGGGEAMTALLGGHVSMAVTGGGEATGLIESGKVKALAVSAPERIESMPDVPTLTELGYDFTFDIWRGVMAPGDLTDSQVDYYENLFSQLVELESWQTESARLGWVDSYLGAEDFQAFLDETNAEFAEILEEVGLARGSATS